MKINPARTLAALASGALLCLSFPKWNGWMLAWVALVPLLLAARGRARKDSFLLGWLAGWTGFCGMLYWIVPTFHAARVPAVVGLGSVALLAGYIALYFGLYATLAEFFHRRFPWPAAFALSVALWTALEFARARLFTGFPWGLLAYSQWRAVPVIQISEWTGVYGVSALLAASNWTAVYWIERRRNAALAGLTVVGLALALNFWLLGRPSAPGAAVTVHLLQGNIDQHKKWSPSYEKEILDSYGVLAAELPPRKDPDGAALDLVVWPETAAPGWIPEDEWLVRWIEDVVRRSGRHHLIGAVSRRGRSGTNSAFLFSPDGKILDHYDKMHLVPFGEFVPMQALLGRWIDVLNQLGGFQPGERAKRVGVNGTQIGVNICYEAIFPELVREQAREGAELIVNMTNDGWYLDTAAPEQHFSMNAFRAVENRRFVVRAANTGISGIIRPDGRAAAVTALNVRGVLSYEVELRGGKTLYAQAGDWFAWLCAAASLAGAAIGFRNQPKELE